MKIFNHSVSEIRELINSREYNLVLYGAGTAVSSYARIAVAALNYHKLSFEFFVDDDEKRTGSTFLGKKIYRYFPIKKKYLVLISSNYFKTIFENKKVFNGDVITSSLVRMLEETPPDAYKSLMSYEEVVRRLHTHKSKLNQILNLSGKNESLFINALDIQVTEKCTMKCKDCSNLMQYYNKPENTDIPTLIISLRKFIKSIDRLADARVLGGEPFIIKDLSPLLNVLIEEEKVEHITIYTNGTIVPRVDLVPALQSKKIVIEITDYDKYSKNLNKLVNFLKENKINYFAHKPQNWTDSARIVKNDLNPEQLSQMFDACCVNDAITLLHNKIYHCPFSANAVNLNSFIPSKNEFIDLNNIDFNDLRNKIKQWYFARPYLDACSYCLGRDFMQPLVDPGVQIKDPIPIPIFMEKR